MPTYIDHTVKSLPYLAMLCLSGLLFASTAQADTTPPATNLILSGQKGNQDWYITSVDVTLRSFDLESSPASTTYKINQDSPIVNQFDTLDNAVINPSFESGWILGINNWSPVGSGVAFMYQASTATIGYRSAAIVNLGGQYQYWTNRQNFVPVISGRNYNVSTWLRTFNVNQAPGAWFEVWGLDSTGTLSDLKIAESDRVYWEVDWTLKGVNFTVPSGYDGVYLRLGSQSEMGITWYDAVSMYTGSDAITQFTLLQNGHNSLEYFSADNQGNVEPTQVRSPIKIDTAQPQDWSNFGWEQTGNNHTYAAWVDVRDITSGIVPASAQYRWYDDANCECWSAWSAVSSVVRTDNGANAAQGYTGYVTLRTDLSDMGNSGNHTRAKVQFRINDVASAVSDSPVYSLFGPWMKVNHGGDIYSFGGIDGLGPIPSSQSTVMGFIAGNGPISNVRSYYSWLVSPYAIENAPSATLATYIPQYDQMRASAQPLSANKLPSASGIYYYPGNYTIDRNSLTADFTSSVYSAVVIIEGDLHINSNYTLNAQTAVAFLVAGNIIYDRDTNTSAGFMVAQGSINTNGSTEANGRDRSLTHDGSLIATNGLVFGRDLGKQRNPDNPAEIINFPISYLVNQDFAALFNGQDAMFTWQETGPDL